MARSGLPRSQMILTCLPLLARSRPVVRQRLRMMTTRLPAAGSTPVSGEASITDDDDTLVSEGDNFAHGAVGNITDEPDTVVAVISTERSGTASITDDPDTVAVTGDNFAEGGFANITDASDTLDATGSVAVAGTAAITDDADTIASSGTSTNLQRRGFVPRNLSPMSMTLGA